MKTFPKTPATELLWELDHVIGYGQTLAAEFAAKYVADPAYTLEWSSNAFADAAKLSVAQGVRTWLLDPSTNGGFRMVDSVEAVTGFCTDIAKELNDQALRAAQFPSRSSSASSNLMAQEIASAKVEMAERLNQIAKRLSK